MAAVDRKQAEAYPDLALIRDAAAEAGRIAMRYFRKDNEVWQKSGNSPVSEADLAVDRFLREELRAARPDYGWLSEETEDNSDRLERESLFVVDPIDGTRGFIAGRSEWCVSIGLVVAGRPVAGVLECPALGCTFEASAGAGAYRDGRRLAIPRDRELGSLTASSKLNELLERKLGDTIRVLPFVPSLAYRIAMVAEGAVDGAFARPGAHDWDLAAADVILEEAGGALVDLDLQPVTYNRPRPAAGSLIASGIARQDKLIRLAKSGGFLH